MLIFANAKYYTEEGSEVHDDACVLEVYLSLAMLTILFLLLCYVVLALVLIDIKDKFNSLYTSLIGDIPTSAQSNPTKKRKTGEKMSLSIKREFLEAQKEKEVLVDRDAKKAEREKERAEKERDKEAKREEREKRKSGMVVCVFSVLL